MTPKSNSKIKFEPATISGLANPKSNEVITVFRVLLRVGDSLFYGKDQFKTETELETEINRLQNTVFPPRKKKVKILEVPVND
jgi:hypothetical protein